MTPEQLTDLESARVKDFILLERPLQPWSLLYMTHINHNPLDGVRYHVKRMPFPTLRDIFKYQRYGTWLFEIENWDIEALPLSVVIDSTCTLTLRPSAGMLRHMMGGRCLYDACEEGLVKTDYATHCVVPWRRCTERVMARMAEEDSWTICPFCMGWDLFERHEYLAHECNVDRFPLAVKRAHLQAVNAKREQNGYDWLLPGVRLTTLAHRTHYAPALDLPVGADGVRNQGPTANRSPELSTHLFGWFEHAQERVLEDGCAICREPFQDGERIADLPCEHFYHNRCVRRHFSFLETAPTCPLCQHAVAP